MVNKIVFFISGSVLSALCSFLIYYFTIFIFDNMMTGLFVVFFLPIIVGCFIYFYNKEYIAFASGVAFGGSAMMIVMMLFVGSFGG
jgi:hypothetical protein